MSITNQLSGLHSIVHSRTAVTTGPDKGKHSGAGSDTVRMVLNTLKEVIEKLKNDTTLDGATNEPAPEVMTGDAGEFAARWNTATPEQREDRWQRMQRAFDVSNKCFQEDHEALLDQVRSMSAKRATAISEVQGLLDSLDDHITQDEIYSALKEIKEAL